MKRFILTTKLGCFDLVLWDSIMRAQKSASNSFCLKNLVLDNKIYDYIDQF